MVQKDQDHWEGKSVSVYLSTPLSTLGQTQEDQPAHVFVLQGNVTKPEGSGLFLKLVRALDDQGREVSCAHQNIFVPFSKIDFVAV